MKLRYLFLLWGIAIFVICAPVALIGLCGRIDPVTQEDMQYAQWRVCVIESDGSDGACAACDAKYNPDHLDFRVDY